MGGYYSEFLLESRRGSPLTFSRPISVHKPMQFRRCSLEVTIGYVRTTASERDRTILEGD